MAVDLFRSHVYDRLNVLYHASPFESSTRIMLKRKVCDIEALHVYALRSKSLQVRYKIELFTGYWMGIEFKASAYGPDQRHI